MIFGEFGIIAHVIRLELFLLNYKININFCCRQASRQAGRQAGRQADRQ